MIRTLVGMWLVLALAGPAHGQKVSSGPVAGQLGDTMLMFVGEPLEVLSIATRREESAWQVPAVAQVITREQIQERGVDTLSEALALVPGFYMAQKEGGTQAHLRGIPGSVLFLYDTVPLGSEMSKSLQFLDEEIALSAVKRIEIIRGPGSVLWGPDAFAGVVNIVPLSGKDLQGVEAGALYRTSGSQVGAYINSGTWSGDWDTRFSLSARQGWEDDSAGNIARFWADPFTAVPPELRLGRGTLDDSYFVEASGRVGYRDRFSIMGRISDFSRSYVLSDPQGKNAWPETKHVPTGFVKLEGKEPLGTNSAVRFSAAYHCLNAEHEIIDRSVKQQEGRFYVEMLYDRSLCDGSGLFTTGISHRANRIEDAPIWDGYLPDYLDSDNENLVPLLDQVDYETRLNSIFGQYTHSFSRFQLLFGARFDDHDQYEDALSYNAALVWQPARQWAVKLVHGMAYRTPYALQLRGADSDLDLEKIVNSGGQISWIPTDGLKTTIGLFHNRIRNHVMEDPYAGLSTPNRQEINGLEVEMNYSPSRDLDLGANFTWLDNSGPDEVYRYNDFSYVDGQTGELVKHFIDLRYPYSIGAKRLFNLSMRWRPTERLHTSLVLRHIGPRDLSYPRAGVEATCDDVWLLDGGVVLDRFPFPGWRLSVTMRNVLDTDYRTPGTYSLIDGEPLTVLTTLQMEW